jgi:hypothetical protein
MDIDTYSRLLHAEYVARTYYQMASAMNVYGKTEQERNQGKHEFTKFRERFLKALDDLRNYEKEK